MWCNSHAPRIWRDFRSALPFQTCLTQTKPILPLSGEHGSQVKDKVDGSVATISIKNVPIGLHVMYLYFPDTPLACVTVALLDPLPPKWIAVRIDHTDESKDSIIIVSIISSRPTGAVRNTQNSGSFNRQSYRSVSLNQTVVFHWKLCWFVLCCYINKSFTFRGSCIVIFSYNESQRYALFLTFIWRSTLHVSDRSTAHHQEYLNTVYTQ
jgi:hypothetical protein